jgi:hypothetical protein
MLMRLSAETKGIAACQLSATGNLHSFCVRLTHTMEFRDNPQNGKTARRNRVAGAQRCILCCHRRTRLPAISLFGILTSCGCSSAINSEPSTLNYQPSTSATMTSQEKALRDFAQYAAKLKGDEKSEAQTFLFHLLAAFGHDPNTLPEGSTFEYRVRFPNERTKFADFVWPGRGLIEMKSRGVKLSKHYQQTFDYWLSRLRRFDSRRESGFVFGKCPVSRHREGPETHGRLARPSPLLPRSNLVS